VEGSMLTRKWRLDMSATEKVCRWKYQSFEETMKNRGQYLEFVGDDEM
jgi:hypothetical protein